MQSTSTKNLHRSAAGNGLPRGALLGAGGLILLTLVLVFTDQALDAARGKQSVTAPDVVYSLVFDDRGENGIAVFLGDEAAPIAVLPDGRSSFLRTVVQSLERVRTKEKVPGDVPFQLVRWTDGTMILADPTTGQYMPLNGFGRDNEDAFRALLTAAEGRT